SHSAVTELHSDMTDLDVRAGLWPTLSRAFFLSRRFHSFLFNDPPPPAIYTLSLHDALPICPPIGRSRVVSSRNHRFMTVAPGHRSEEHTSELQSRVDLVCRLLLEKKKQYQTARLRTQRSDEVACEPTCGL